MPVRLTLRLYEELNDYLPPDERKVAFTHVAADASTVRDVLRTLGVPLDRVEIVLVNGESVDFARRLRDGDRVSSYPTFESLDISSALRVRPHPLRDPRFVVDNGLGRLAAYLRGLGLDALYRGDCTGDELIALSRKERRVLLSRNGELVHRRALTHAYRVRADTPRAQLTEVLARFDLFALVSGRKSERADVP